MERSTEIRELTMAVYTSSSASRDCATSCSTTRAISRRIVLVDGRMLARLMYDYGIAVRSHRSLDVKRLDDAYFEGDS